MKLNFTKEAIESILKAQNEIKEALTSAGDKLYTEEELRNLEIEVEESDCEVAAGDNIIYDDVFYVGGLYLLVSGSSILDDLELFGHIEDDTLHVDLIFSGEELVYASSVEQEDMCHEDEDGRVEYCGIIVCP